MYTKNSTETKRLAAKLAKRLLKNKNLKTATVVALIGDLGAGKTTFVQGFAKGLGLKARIISPTFLIFRRYLIDQLTNDQFTNFYHVDAYRIKKIVELKPLGFKAILSEPKNLVVIEWADNLKKVLPKNLIRVDFNYGLKDKQRKIKIHFF